MKFYKILFLMLLLSIVAMTGCGQMKNTTTVSTDTTAPTVTLTVPLNGATSVAINSKISATFSEAMDPATITAANFTLKQGTTAVAGTVVYTGVTAVFTPTAALTANAIYNAEISTSVKDLAGNALAVKKTWIFTTSTAADTIAPTVSSTSPADLDVNVAINKNIAATFGEAMDPTTITTSTFTLKQGTTTIACAVSYVGYVATLNPTSDLSAGTEYTATIKTGVTDLAGNALAVDKTWSFTTGTNTDTTAPTVSSTIPNDVATSVAINSNITATFSEAMDPAAITAVTFTLLNGTTPVPCDVTYVGSVATLNPTSNLTINTLYTAMINTSATDLAGNALAANKIWTFTTGTGLDITAPIVGSTSPTSNATGVAVNSDLTATFSEGMDPTTLTNATFVLRKGTTIVTSEVTYVGLVATLNPASDLITGSTYEATITTGVKDIAGNALAANKTWTFTTGTGLDITAPIISSTSPTSDATGVVINSDLTATFSEGMDPTTLTGATFILRKGTTIVTSEVTYVGLVATLNPASDLITGSTYEATITTGVKDIAGNALAANHTWIFTTPKAGPDAVVLGLAGNFAILDKATITNAGSLTTVVGDIGVSPASYSFITGFTLTPTVPNGSNTDATSPYVTGKVYAANYTEPTPTNMGTTIGNMETADTLASAPATPAGTGGNLDIGAGTVGAATPVFAPGTYTWTTPLNITGDITLSGGENDVWIFQIPGTLTVASAAIVTLSGGAQAKNIFWHVAGNTVLDTTSQFKGIILEETQITMNTGATLNGRALAKTGVLLGNDCHVIQP